MPPRLASIRLTLDPTAPADLPDLLAIWNHAEVRRYLFDDQIVTPERATELLRQLQASDQAGLGSWTLRLSLDATVIGQAGLMPTSESAKLDPRLAGFVEPVIAIDPAFQRRGLGREALAVVLGHAFDTVGLTTLAAAVDSPNTASIRLVERAGFELLGEVPGLRHTLRTYLLSAEAYARSNRREA